MRLILNILWFVLGGWIAGLLWLLGGAILAVTIIGLPWAGAAFRIAAFAFWPLGKEVVDRRFVTGREDAGAGGVGLLLNLIWFLLAGWYIALAHILIAAAEAVTIIGIPFAIKDLQLAILALAPIGKAVVEKR